MSLSATVPTVTAPLTNGERRHRFRLLAAWTLAGLLSLALTLYGFNYYTLSTHERPLSAKHHLLKPSGTIGVRLGMLGAVLFFGIYLYPVRKRWPWLAKQGSSKHWLDIHVVLGVTAPVLIAFHSSFKFRGVAGVAFWIMVAVSLSGVVGRYLYAQIPRRLSAAELSLKDMQELHERLAHQLAGQKLFAAADLAPLFRLPAIQRVQTMPLLLALGIMMLLDLERPFHVARLRWRTLDLREALLTLGGILPSGNRKVEGIIGTARRQSAFSKRILFLTRSQQVFHLWHVVHRPFSYSFALLACIHILVVILLGYV